MQVTGADLTEGQVFRTIDGLGGRATSIATHKKGWREVTVEDPDGLVSNLVVSIFDRETIDIDD